MVQIFKQVCGKVFPLTHFLNSRFEAFRGRVSQITVRNPKEISYKVKESLVASKSWSAVSSKNYCSWTL